MSFPFSSRTKFSRSVPKPVSSSCRLYTGCRRDRKPGSPANDMYSLGWLNSFLPGLSWSNCTTPVSTALENLTMRHRTVCFRSSPRHVPDICPMPFPWSFTTTPSERSSTGRFEANSCKPAPGGPLPSSVQHQGLSPVFVTHCSLIHGKVHNRFMPIKTPQIPQSLQLARDEPACNPQNRYPTPPPFFTKYLKANRLRKMEDCKQ